MAKYEYDLECENCKDKSTCQTDGEWYRDEPYTECLKCNDGDSHYLIGSRREL